MKKIIAILCLLPFSGFLAIAQEYDPLLKRGAFWDFETWGDAAGGPSPCAYYQKKYVVDQDTIINGHVYKKVIRYPLQIVPDEVMPECAGVSSHYSANVFIVEDLYLREDIENQIVYIWTRVYEDLNNSILSDYKEMVLYAFDVEVGDVIPSAFQAYQVGGVLNYGFEITETIAAVDINTNGKKQITTFGDGDFWSWYTEGIGTDYNLFKTIPTLSPSQTLVCYGNSDNQNGCSEILSTSDQQWSQIKIFPNPTTGSIFFTHLDKNSTITLHSILGKAIKVPFLKEHQEMDISHLAAGVYLLKIQAANKASRLLRIVKN